MNNCWCDVVGCGYSAAWVRVADINNAQEEFLCHHCRAALCAFKPQQAACYTCFKDNHGTNDADIRLPFSAKDDNEPIRIG